MKNFLLLLVFIPIFSISQEDKQNNSIKNQNLDFSNLSDGPYVFVEKNNLIEKRIINGEISSKVLGKNTYDTIYYPEKSTFKKINTIAALSDIHGQYDLVIELLINNEIIDKNLNWIFGEGHLVIAGDVFDRGDKVNEVLWLIYNLEIQAKNSGGHVHFLLGNHEYMVLQKDLRYISDKYKLTSKLLKLDYDELYGKKTIIGRWLRSKSTIIKINSNVFTHGGLSEEFISNNGSNFKRLNNKMRKYIDLPKNEIINDDIYNLYYGDKSLIWYRDYFKKYGDDLTDSDVSKILRLVNSQHIVVGHCSQDHIVQLYNNKIFGVDSSIKNGKYGEILIIRDKQFFRATLNGNKTQF